MPAKIYRIKLSLDERAQLESLTRSQNAPVRKALKAKALLLCDEGPHGSALKDSQVLAQCDILPRALDRLRKKSFEVGALKALERKVRVSPPRIRKFGGYQQAQLVQLACSDAPEGCARWTLSLLAERLVEMNVVESVSRETIRRELKKTNLNLGEKNVGASLPRKMQPS